jgi:hypothetical protein
LREVKPLGRNDLEATANSRPEHQQQKWQAGLGRFIGAAKRRRWHG